MLGSKTAAKDLAVMLAENLHMFQARMNKQPCYILRRVNQFSDHIAVQYSIAFKAPSQSQPERAGLLCT